MLFIGIKILSLARVVLELCKKEFGAQTGLPIGIVMS